jgi:hypothetical protein
MTSLSIRYFNFEILAISYLPFIDEEEEEEECV